MGDLIQINTNSQGDHTVDARRLHKFLGVKTEFKDWIARRINEYDFIEGIDFSSFLSESTGGRPLKGYDIKIPMAKEISMVEKNEKGKQARKYFIECERKSKQPQLPDFTNPVVAARAYADTYEQKLLAEKQRDVLEVTVKEQEPKVLIYERIAGCENEICIRDTARYLQIRPKDLRDVILVPDSWIFQPPGHSSWRIYSDKLKQGVMKNKTIPLCHKDGTFYTKLQPMCTHKGLIKLAKRITAIEESGEFNFKVGTWPDKIYEKKGKSGRTLFKDEY